MSFIERLPKYILHEIFGEWCGLKDLTQMDSATGEKIDRQKLLDLFSNEHFSMSCEEFGLRDGVRYAKFVSKNYFYSK